MAEYFSKSTLLSAYKELANLTSDPSAQGATQATSSLRYIFALDEFYKTFGKPCDTQNRTDRDNFIKCVGNVVSIEGDLYTANFYHSLKKASDYSVGSNFFSVNVVKTSLENKVKEYEFPKRGNSPLFLIQGGKLIENEQLLPNINNILNTIKLRVSFILWLARDMQVDSNNLYDSLISALRNRYSENIIGALELSEYEVTSFTNYSFSDTKPIFSLGDFPKSATKVNDLGSDKVLTTKEVESKVRDSFAHFMSLVNQHTSDFSDYIDMFEKTLSPYIAKLNIGYDNVFQILSFDQYNAILDRLQNDFAELDYLAKERENNGNKYMVWSCHRYYRNFLSILANSDFRANIDSQQKRSLQVISSVTSQSHTDYLRAMRTKPFLLLAGISGTGKSRIVKQMAFDSCPDNAVLRSDLTSPGNYCLIEVKPNWHDSTELLGYESQIGKPHYQLTPFVKFLAKAMLYPDVPFFVCLDEMNLAPVEQYFAEFLSVLESRTKIDGHIVSEPLVKADIFKKYNLSKSLFSTEKEEKIYDQAQSTVEPEQQYGKEVEVYNSLEKYGLRIPENVIVIGTVNMDETTHQFSRKVIDRAMTIEMNLPEGEPFMDFFNNASELGYRSTPISPSLYLATETKASDVVKALSKDNAEKTDWLKGEVASFLTNLNEKLDGTPFKVAYRVQNELMLYFYQLWLEDKTARWRDILNTACDQILMMKVLPRMEGDGELLETPLDELARFCEPYTNASKKIAEMKSRLEKSQFTSFWP